MERLLGMMKKLLYGKTKSYLALFLAIALCLGMVQFSTAADGSEPTTELDLGAKYIGKDVAAQLLPLMGEGVPEGGTWEVEYGVFSAYSGTEVYLNYAGTTELSYTYTPQAEDSGDGSDGSADGGSGEGASVEPITITKLFDVSIVVADEDDLRAACDRYDESEYHVTSDFSVESTVDVWCNKLALYLDGHTISLADESNCSIFSIENSGYTLSLYGPGAIVGHAGNNSALVSVEYGYLNLRDGVALRGNANSGNGGAIYCYNGSVTIFDAAISGCSAANGGAIYSDNYGSVAVYDGSFSGNTATAGGDIYVASGTVSLPAGLSVDAVVDEENGELLRGEYTVYSADELVSLLRSISSPARINVANALTNEYEEFGGVLDLKGCTLYSNGGRMFIVYSPLTIQNGSIVGNARDEEIEKSDTLMVVFSNLTLGSGLSVSDNENPNGDGGAVYCLGGSTVIVNGATIERCSAQNGGAIAGGGIVEINDGALKNNSAVAHGGAIMTEGKLTVRGGSFSGNTAGDRLSDGATGGFGSITVEGGIAFEEETDKKTEIGSEDELIAALAEGGEYTLTADFSVTRGLNVTRSVVLDMGGHTITSERAEETPLFTVSTLAGSLTLKGDGKIVGQKGENAKGALITVVYGAFELTDSVALVDNENPQNGGAIYNYGGTVNISGGSISGCSAANGGAIYSEGFGWIGGDYDGYRVSSVVDISGGRFENNSAVSNGGAVYSIGGTPYYDSYFAGTCRIEGGEFVGNTAENGGAIYSWDNLDIAGGSFIDNTATENGGAIYDYDVYNTNYNIDYILCRVRGGVFSGNKALGSEEDPTVGCGGGVYGDKVNVSGGSFDENSAKLYGGAVYADDECYVEGGSFLRNAATGEDADALGSGGAISALSLDVFGGTFTENTAVGRGGALHARSRQASVSGGKISANSAAQGGALAVDHSDSELVVSIIAGIAVDNHVGDDRCDVYLDISEGDDLGDSFYVSPSLGLKVTPELESTISVLQQQLYELESGGTLTIPAEKTEILKPLLIQKDVTIVVDHDVEYTDNRNSLFTVADGATLTLKGDGGIGGISLGDGGSAAPLVHVLRNSEFVLDGPTLRGHAVSGNGGAVFGAQNSRITIKSGEISDCRANNGGGIYSLGDVSISGGKIARNVATNFKTYTEVTVYGGGGVYMESGTLTLSDGEISKNEAWDDNNNNGGGGGGIHIAKNAAITMTGGTIDRNRTGREGGGIFISSSGSNSISGGRITNNRTETLYDWGGGGVFINAGADLNIKNALITDNTSDGIGAGVSGCPHADVKIFTNMGMAIYNNRVVDNPARGLTWLTVGRSYGGDPIPPAEVAARDNGFNATNSADFYCAKESSVESIMLAGYNAGWTGLRSDSIGSGYRAAKAVGPDDFVGNSISCRGLLGMTSTAPSAEKQAEIDALVGVVISGNHSTTHGGGVGCNGTLIFGVKPTDTPSPGPSYSLTISKRLGGNEVPDAAKDKEYTFNVSGEKFAKDVTIRGEGSATLSLPSEGSYTVTERSAEIEGYVLTVTGGGVQTVSISEGSNSVAFENTYTKEEEPTVGSLTIVKKLGENAPEEAADKEFAFVVSGPEGYSERISIVGAGSRTLTDLLPGSYTVAEDSSAAAIYGYRLTVAEGGEQSVEVEVGKEPATLEFTNVYVFNDTPRGSLTVSKVVVGYVPGYAADRAFAITVSGPDGYSASFELKNGESRTLVGLVAGEYSVVEDTGAAAIDGCRLYVTGTGAVAIAEGGASSVTVTNEYRHTTPPDPNDPDTPDTITIWDEDTPTSYIKVWDPEEEEWVWIEDDEVALGSIEVEKPTVPKTGDESAVGVWTLLLAISLVGMISLFFGGRTKRHGKHEL